MGRHVSDFTCCLSLKTREMYAALSSPFYLRQRVKLGCVLRASLHYLQERRASDTAPQVCRGMMYLHREPRAKWHLSWQPSCLQPQARVMPGCSDAFSCIPGPRPGDQAARKSSRRHRPGVEGSGGAEWRMLWGDWLFVQLCIYVFNEQMSRVGERALESGGLGPNLGSVLWETL